MTNNNLNFIPAALALCEVLLKALMETNRLEGRMAYQSHAYGKVAEALTETMACAIADTNPIYFPDARAIAERLYRECIDNGENVAYQIDLWNRDIISL